LNLECSIYFRISLFIRLLYRVLPVLLLSLIHIIHYSLFSLPFYFIQLISSLHIILTYIRINIFYRVKSRIIILINWRIQIYRLISIIVVIFLPVSPVLILTHGSTRILLIVPFGWSHSRSIIPISL
jgi:hypothetical protein